MFRFLKSSHKLTYLRIALLCHCSPDHVYDVAHGKADMLDDSNAPILKRLRDAGQMRRTYIKKHRHHHKSDRKVAPEE